MKPPGRRGDLRQIARWDRPPAFEASPAGRAAGATLTNEGMAMGDIPRAGAIRGTTMKWAWTDGPTKGKVYEHVFHEDGTVEWHDAGQPRKPGSKPSEPAERSRRQATGERQ